MLTMDDNSPIFLDTNILLRCLIQDFPEHFQVRSAVGRLSLQGNSLWLSRQVLREFSVVVIRPQSFLQPLTSKDVAVQLRNILERFNVADENAKVTEYLLALMEAYPLGGKQVHDANIVATMQANNLTHIDAKQQRL